MQVKVQVRDSSGAFRYRDSNVGEFAEYSINQIIDDGRNHGSYGLGDGWWWLKQWLCMVMIRRAEKCAMASPAQADLWFKRYQALRSIGENILDSSSGRSVC